MATKTATTNDTVIDEVPKHPFWGSARMTYTLVAFFAMVLHLCMRNTINFVVLCMVEEDPTEAKERAVYLAAEDECGLPDHNRTFGARSGNIQWTRSEEFTVLGTFYYGYIVTLPLGGRLADRFGGKMLFVHSLTGQAFVFLLMPLFARINFQAMVAICVLQGLIAGCGNPAIYQLFSVWAHPKELSRLLSFAYGGYSVGSLVVFPLSSFLCRFSWEYAFYVVGSVSLVFGISCHFLVYSTLLQHPRLSPMEYKYLSEGQQHKNQLTLKVPWKLIFTSVPIYAFALTHIFHTYGIIMITILIPMFFTEAMRFSLDEVGWLAAAPFLGVLLSKTISVTSCGYFEKRHGSNLTKFRRYVYVGSNIGTILFMIGVMSSNCNQKILVVMLTLCMGFTIDLGFAGAYWPSLLVVAPAFSGLISGISNCLATVSGFLGPLSSSAIIKNGTKAEWNYVWLTLIVSYSLGAIVFGCCGSSKLLPWGTRRRSVDDSAVSNELKA